MSSRWTRVARSWVLSLILAVTGSALAAQVNTEALRPKGDAEGLSGAVGFDLAARRGNSDVNNFGLNLNLFQARPFAPGDNFIADRPVDRRFLSPKRLYLFVANYDFQESSGERSVNRGFVHARGTWMQSPRFGWEAFGQLETDEFIRLDRRSLLGAGIRYGVFQRERATLFIGQGIMGEWERIDEEAAAGAPFDPDRNTVRLTSYMVVRRQSRDERVELTGTIYVQPAVDDLSDYRVLQQSRLSTALTESWSLVVQLNVRHDSDPEFDVDETDLELSTGFGFRF